MCDFNTKSYNLRSKNDDNDDYIIYVLNDSNIKISFKEYKTLIGDSKINDNIINAYLSNIKTGDNDCFIMPTNIAEKIFCNGNLDYYKKVKI